MSRGKQITVKGYKWEATGSSLRKILRETAQRGTRGLSGLRLKRQNLSRLRLPFGTILHRAELEQSNCNGMFLQSACMTKAELHNTSFACADLMGANLDDAKAHQANFARAELSACTAKRFLGWQVNFQAAVCSHASFQEAWLPMARFSKAMLHSVNFSDANLSQARFCGAHLQYADFTNAALAGADFRKADLRYAKISYDQLKRCFVDCNTVLPLGVPESAKFPLFGPEWKEDWVLEPSEQTAPETAEAPPRRRLLR